MSSFQPPTKDPESHPENLSVQRATISFSDTTLIDSDRDFEPAFKTTHPRRFREESDRTPDKPSTAEPPLRDPANAPEPIHEPDTLQDAHPVGQDGEDEMTEEEITTYYGFYRWLRENGIRLNSRQRGEADPEQE